MSQKVNPIALRLSTENYWKIKTKKFDSTTNNQKNLLLLKFIQVYLAFYNMSIVCYKIVDWEDLKFFFGYIYIQKNKKKNKIFFKKKLIRSQISKAASEEFVFWKNVKNIKKKLKKLNNRIFKLKRVRWFVKKQKKILKTFKKKLQGPQKKKYKARVHYYYPIFLKLRKLQQKKKMFSYKNIKKLINLRYWTLKKNSYATKTKLLHKNQIKNSLILFKIKLKIQTKIQKIFKCFVNLQLKNAWCSLPDNLKRKNWTIFKKARQHKQNKNLAELILVMNLLFFFKKVNFFTDFIAKELEKRKQHWKILNSVKYVMHELNRLRLGIIGFRIVVWGKINNSKRTRKYTISMGKVALNNIKYRADYGISHSYTSYGLFGIKGWLVY